MSTTSWPRPRATATRSSCWARPATPLSTLSDVDDDLLREIWAAVDRLHGAGLTHGELTLEPIVGSTAGKPVLSDFGDGAIAATEAQRAQEVAVLLTSQALAVGADRAVDAALAGLGADTVAARAALPPAGSTAAVAARPTRRPRR